MNYIGSKLSLLPFIDESILNVAGEVNNDTVFCDLFAGTGIVGRHYKNKGCSIISNDLQYYSYVLNKNYICNNAPLQFQGLEDEVLFDGDVSREVTVCAYLDNLEPVNGFIYDNYAQGEKDDNYRLYFTNYNASKCDAIRLKIEKWNENNMLTEGEYYFLISTLLENIDKVANTTSVYGAFLKKIKKSAMKQFKMNPAEFYCSENNCNQVYNMDANELARNIRADIVYLDPPYNQRQYSSNYHILETIAMYDNPKLRGKTGMRDNDSQKSDYCSKRKVLESFSDLIMNLDAKYIFLSYNNEGLMSFEEIRDIMSQRGTYRCFSKDYARYKADQESDIRNIAANKTIEFLHCLEVED